MIEDEFLKNIEELKKNLDALTEKVSVSDKIIESCVNDKNFLESKEIRNFLDAWNEFKRILIEDCKQCEKAINTPIYLGIVGHYSHGKSSLINALISPPNSSEEILPTGEGIITSKITLIQFTVGSDIERFGCKKNGESEYIHEDVFKRLVSGRMENPWDYFIIKVGYSISTDKDFFSNLFKYNIVFCDTPGLGTSYWSDRSELQEWLETFDVVLLCIDGTKIAPHLLAVLSEILNICRGKLIIPIITKWDKWKECENYKGISGEFEAQQKAKDLLRGYLPPLADSLDKGLIYFVSAHNYMFGKEVPQEILSEFTDSWNIDQVRQELARLVLENKNILIKTRRESAKLANKRKREISEAVSRILDDFEKLYSRCEDTLPSFPLKSEVLQIFYDGFEEFNRRIRERCINISNTISNIIQDGVSSITDYSEIDSQQSELEIKVENTQKKLIEEYKETNLEHWFNETIKNPVIKKLKNSLDDEKGRGRIDELEQEMKELLEKFKSGISPTSALFQPVEHNLVLVQKVAIESLMSIFNALTEYTKWIISTLIRILSPLINPTFLIYGGVIAFTLLVLWVLGDKIDDLKNYLDGLNCSIIKPWTYTSCALKFVIGPIIGIVSWVIEKIFDVIFGVLKWIGKSILYFLKANLIWILIGLAVVFAVFYVYSFIKEFKKTKQEVLNSVKEQLRTLHSYDNIKKIVSEIIKIHSLDDIYKTIDKELRYLLDDLQNDEIVHSFSNFSNSIVVIKRNIYNIKTRILIEGE